ncbi:MAG TPA: cyclodeaminase/cyclohydrolase family protein [bacterium]|jgi:formiminotetrahydrofolate cyclodeaminase
MLITQTINDFLKTLASEAPTPGGGSVAALDGALGVALLEMVCDLTIGKEKFREVWPDFEEIKPKLEELREELTASIDRDAGAYDMVTSAFQMPKSTDTEKKARKEAIQASLKSATDVPKSTMKYIHDAMKLAMDVAEKGNPNVVSDAGVGMACLNSAMLSAAMNVAINLGMIKDEGYVGQVKKEIDFLLKEAQKLNSQVTEYVKKAIGLD